MTKKMLYALLILISLSVGYVNAVGVTNSINIANNDDTVTINSKSGVPASLVKNTAPKDYVVKKSDTVMKLAQMYLKKTSYWPQFLGISEIYNTKIYPGDQLHILSIDGVKILSVEAISASTHGYEKLVPTVRDISTEELPAISLKKLRNLILKPTLIDRATFDSLPMVVSGGEQGASFYTTGETIYVKGLTGLKVGEQVSIFSKFRQLADPDTKESLGYEVRYDGDAIINQLGPISSLEITSAINQIGPLDRVMTLPSRSLPVIIPHKAPEVITGKIIALYDAITSTAEDNTVVINRGSRDGVDIGQIFDITDTRRVTDPTSNPDKPQYLIMPPKVVGELLIYKVYDKVSFGLITDSTTAIPNNAVVQSQQ